MKVTIGDVVRYATGPAALMQVTHIEKGTLYGVQCCGRLSKMKATAALPLLEADQQQWDRHEQFRRALKVPKGAAIAADEFLDQL